MSPAPTTSRTIRGTAGIVWLAVTAVVVVFLLGDVVVRGSWSQAALIAPWLLLPVWVVWTFLAAPHLTADDRGMTVRNPLRTATIPWASVERIDLTWQIVIRLAGGGEVQAWAVAARRASRRSPQQPAERELEILREMRAEAAPSAAGGTVRRRWNLDVVASFAVLVAWTVASVAIA